MRASNYPYYKFHVEQHEGFRNDLAAFKDRLIHHGPDSTMTVKLRNMLVGGWAEQINLIDRPPARCIDRRPHAD